MTTSKNKLIQSPDQNSANMNYSDVIEYIYNIVR